MEFSEQVLILHVGKFKETDIWVRFLSPSKGVLSAFAFGGSRSKRRFVGCLDIFNQVLFRIQSTQQGAYLCLQEGVLMNGPKRLRSDWGRLGMASNCAKFLQSFGVMPEGAARAHDLFLDVLQVLEEKDTVPTLLPFFFRARLAFEQGYAVGLEECAHCGSAFTGAGAAFHVREGLLLCPDCTRFRGERGVRLNANALAALQRVGHEPLHVWDAIALSGGEKSELSRAIDGFIQFHVGISWENGRFCRR